MSAADLDMPAVPASDAAGEAAMTDWAEQLVAQARAEGAGLTGDDGLLTGLVRRCRSVTVAAITILGP